METNNEEKKVNFFKKDLNDKLATTRTSAIEQLQLGNMDNVVLTEGKLFVCAAILLKGGLSIEGAARILCMEMEEVACVSLALRATGVIY